MNPRDLHHQTASRIASAMTCAMRADQTATAALLAAVPGDLDAHTRAFLTEARPLALTLTAALTTVLHIHRPIATAPATALCGGCGAPGCRTVHAVAGALTAYGRRSTAIDRAEAWRRADAWYTGRLKTPTLIAVESFDGGYITRPVPTPPDLPRPVLIFDRSTGTATSWPDLPTPALLGHYGRRPAP